MEQKIYDIEKLTKIIQDKIESGLSIETNSHLFDKHTNLSFIIDKEFNLFHYFKCKEGKVYLYYIKRLLDSNGEVLFENQYCNINYSVYDIMKNVFGRKTANRYAKWQSMQDFEK